MNIFQTKRAAKLQSIRAKEPENVRSPTRPHELRGSHRSQEHPIAWSRKVGGLTGLTTLAKWAPDLTILEKLGDLTTLEKLGDLTILENVGLRTILVNSGCAADARTILDSAGSGRGFRLFGGARGGNSLENAGKALHIEVGQ